RLDEELMKKRDERVTLMSQVLSAIRVVKYFVWERSVLREVQKVRHEELRTRGELASAEMSATLIYVGISTMVLFLVLGTHVWRGHALDAALVFTLVSLFRMIEEPFSLLSRQISALANARVSAQRISSFLSRLAVDDGRLEKLPENSPYDIEI